MSRSAGDAYLVVRRSHRWYWKPRFTWGSPSTYLGIHWLRLYVDLARPTRDAWVRIAQKHLEDHD